MGNEQSAPLPRRPPNKLSKPRTNNNSTSNLLSAKTSNPTTRQSSVSANVSSTRSRYSTILVEVVPGEAGENRNEETTQRKRMSLFRSKNSQDRLKLQLDVSVETHSAEPSLLDQPDPRWSGPSRERSSQRLFELAGEEPYLDSATEM